MINSALFPTRRTRRTLALHTILAGSIAALLGGQSAQAATVYYDSNTGTGSFVGSFWSPNSTGGADAALAVGSDVIFSSTAVTLSGLSTITTSALALNSIAFNAGNTGGYTFTNAGIITLGNATTGNTIVSMAAGTGAVTFAGQITLAAGVSQTYTVTNNSSSLLSFNGNIVQAVAGNTTQTLAITGAGAGGVTFNGGLQGNNNSINAQGKVLNLSISGGGLVTLNAANIGVGDLSLVAGGALTLGNTLALQGYDLNQTGGTFSFGTLTSAQIAGLAGSSNLVLTNASSGAVALTVAGYGNNNATSTGGSSPTFSGNISGLGGLTFSGVQLTNRSTGGTATYSGLLTFTGAAGLTVNDTAISGTAGGASTYLITGANTTANSGYTGPTTLNAGTLKISGAAGSIAASSGTTVTGTAAILTLDNTSGVADKLKDTGAVTLSNGANFNLTGNGAADTSETFGSLAIGAGATQTVTIASAASRVTTLNAGAVTNSFTRTGAGTALIRGTSLDQSSATNVSRFTLGDGGASLGLVGTNTLSGGATNDATQALKISPFLFGDTSVAGAGKNFLTYDSVLGLRVLNATENTTLVAGSVTAANPVNAVAFGGTVTTAGLTVNSLLFNVASQTLDGSGALTVNSGAVAAVTNTEVIGSGFSSLALGNGEGVITTTSGNTLTINTPISVTSSGGLTKTGAGTLTLGAANSYTGATKINQGTLNVGGGTTAGDLGTSSGVALNGASSLTFNRATNPFSYTGAITGTGATGGSTVTQAGSGALTLGAISGVQTITQSASTGSLTTGNITNAATITHSAGAGTLTLGAITGITTLTDSSITGSTTPTTITQSGTGLTIGTINGASGSVVNIGGTGTTAIANILNTTGQTVSFNGGTFNLNGFGAYNSTLIVNGATVNMVNTAGNGSNYQQLPDLRVLTGTLNVQSQNGLRLGTNFGVNQPGTNNAAGIQSGGNIVFTSNSGLQLGGNAGGFTTTFGLSGGIFNGSAGSNLLIDATVGVGASSFNFSGGTLLLNNTIAGTTVTTTAAKSFVWIGGTLAALGYNATNLTSTQGTAVSAGVTNILTNNGTGILAPGNTSKTGLTTVTGNYTQGGTATLNIDLGGTTASTVFQDAGLTKFDKLTVTGTATLAGSLVINVLAGFTPINTNTFAVVTAASLSGSGTSFTNGSVVLTTDSISSFTVDTTTTANTLTLKNYAITNQWNSLNGTWGSTTTAPWSGAVDPNSTSAGAYFGTLVAGGTVTLDQNRTVGSLYFVNSTSYTLGNGGGGTLTLSNASGPALVIVNTGSHTINAPITLGTDVNVTAATTTTLTIGGAISGTSKAFTASGAGTVVLSGANTYTGNTTISAGTLNLGIAESVNVSGPLGKQLANAAGTILMTGGTLQYSASNNNDYSGRFSTAGSQLWTIDTNSQLVTFATALQGASSTLTKSGAGTLTLSAANNYTGATLISADTLTVNSTGSLGTGALTLSSTAVLNLNNTAQTVGTLTTAAGTTINLNTGHTLTVVGTAGSTLLGSIAGLGALVVNQSGQQINLNASNTFSGGLTLKAGTIFMGGANTTTPLGIGGTITLGDTSGTANALITISNGGGGNTFSNAINVVSGSSGTVTLESTSGPLTFNGLVTLARNLALSNTNNAGSNLTLGGGITGTGNITATGVNGGSSFLLSGATAINITGTISNLSTNVGGTLTISAPIQGGATALLENSTVAAPMILTGANNTYTGSTTIQNGILTAGATNTLSPATTVTLGIGGAANTATLNLGTGTTSFDQTVAGLSALGTNLALDTITNNDTTAAFAHTATLTVNPDGAVTPVDSTFGGVIKDGTTSRVALTKAGSRILTLSGANTYTGPTIVTAGTLNVSGSLSGTTSVALNGGKLLLSGAAGEQVNDGATVALGGGTLGFNNLANQIETLGTLAVGASSTLDFGLNGGADKFLFAALPTRTGGTLLTIDNWIGNQAGGVDGTHDRLVFLGDVAAPGSFATVFGQSDVSFIGYGTGYTTIPTGTTSYEIVAVPEPSSTALAGAAALLGLIGFRTRRRLCAPARRQG